MQGVQSQKETPPTEAAPGAWSSPLFGCCADPGLSCMVCICTPITTGQLYERSARTGLIERVHALWTCWTVALFLLAGFVLSELLADTQDHTCTALALLCGLAATLCTVFVLTSVRKAVRERDRIEVGACCGEGEDCCCSFWCSPCTQCQIWRHERVYCSKYSLCNPTGSPVAHEALREAKDASV